MIKQHATKCKAFMNMGMTRNMQPVECDCDGYHTFTELYDHRITLYITLCAVLRLHTNLPIWRSKKHSDGSEWERWFILGISQMKGRQITYHLPVERWDDTSFALTYDQAPEFDGHTSDDVINRLKTL